MPVQEIPNQGPLGVHGGGGDAVEWHVAKLRAIREQMHELEIVCPLLWIQKGMCESVCPNKLLDLMNFAPTDWDSVVCALVIITRGVLLHEKSFLQAQDALMECRAATAWLPGREPSCPLIARYHTAMGHMVDSTWVMLKALHTGSSVNAVLDTMAVSQRKIPKVHSLSVADQAAIAAVRSLAFQIVHYTQWPSLMDERKPVFKEALASASCAMTLAREEGVWHTLYGRCLAWSNPNKSILLQAGFRQHPTAFTTIEYASFLAYSSFEEAVKESAKLLELAIRRWPTCVYVLANYVTLFLNSNVRALLSVSTAEVCLRRARTQAPDSPLLAGHHWSLRDVCRAGGHLSPILEEGANAFGPWSAEKEAALVAIAARLYPTAMVHRKRLTLPAQGAPPAPAAPREQDQLGRQDPAADSDAEVDGEMQGPNTLWSPKPLRKPKPVNRGPSPSRTPSPDSSCSPKSSVNSSSITPVTSPDSTSAKPPGTSLRMRCPQISGPLRRPRTATSSAEPPPVSSSSPEHGVPASASAETSAPPSTALLSSPSPPPIVPPPPEFSDAPVTQPSAPAAPLAAVASVAAASEVSLPRPRRSFPAQSPPAAAFRARSTTPSPVTVLPVAPVAPVVAPVAPVVAPVAPVVAPVAPVVAPVAPVVAPVAPVVAPVAPVVAPVAPLAAPVAPVVAPVAPIVPPARRTPSVPVPFSAAPTAPCPAASSDPPKVSATSVLTAAVRVPPAATTLRPPAAVCTPAPEQKPSDPVPLMSVKVLPPLLGSAPAPAPAPAPRASAVQLTGPFPCRAQGRLDRLNAQVQPKDADLNVTPTATKRDLAPAENVTTVPGLGQHPSSALPVSKADSLPFSAPAQSRLDRLHAAAKVMFKDTEQRKVITPARKRDLAAVPDLIRPSSSAFVPMSVSSPEAKTATSSVDLCSSVQGAVPGSTASLASPGPVHSRLRPTAPSWTPPSVRPVSRPASPSSMPPLRPRSPSSAAMRPVALRPAALPTAPPTPPQPVRMSRSEALLGQMQPYILPPIEYKCPAQGRLARLASAMPKREPEQLEVKAKPDLTAHVGGTQDIKEGPVKLEHDLGFVTPPESEPFQLSKTVPCAVKLEISEDISERYLERTGRAVRNLRSQFDATVKTEPVECADLPGSPQSSHQGIPAGPPARAASEVEHPSPRSDMPFPVPNLELFKKLQAPQATPPSCPHGAQSRSTPDIVPRNPHAAFTCPDKSAWSFANDCGKVLNRYFGSSGDYRSTYLPGVFFPLSGAQVPGNMPNVFVSPPSSRPSFMALPPSNSFVALPPRVNTMALPPSNSFVALPPRVNTMALPPSSTSFVALPAASNTIFAPPPVAAAPCFVGSSPATFAPLPAAAAASSPGASMTATFASPPAASAASSPEGTRTASCVAPPPPVAAATISTRPSRSVCPDALQEVRKVLLEGQRSRSPAWETVSHRRHRQRSSSPERRCVWPRTASPAGLSLSRTPSSASPVGSSPSMSRAASPAPGDYGDHVPLWRRGGSDAVQSREALTQQNKSSDVFGSTWRKAPQTPCPEPMPSAVPDPPAAAPCPSSATSSEVKPTTDPSPSINCVCSTDCIIATYKEFGDLRPGPEVPKRCLKKPQRVISSRPTVTTLPRRLPSRLAPQFLD